MDEAHGTAVFSDETSARPELRGLTRFTRDYSIRDSISEIAI